MTINWLAALKATGVIAGIVAAVVGGIVLIGHSPFVFGCIAMMMVWGIFYWGFSQ